MSDDITIVDWLFKTFAAICMAIIGFFTKRVINDVHDLQKESAECKINLANYKTEASNTYAKEATTQQSLARIHDRLDQIITLVSKQGHT